MVQFRACVAIAEDSDLILSTYMVAHSQPLVGTHSKGSKSDLCMSGACTYRQNTRTRKLGGKLKNKKNRVW